MAQEPFAEQVIGTIAGAARMAAAGGGDVVRLTSPPEDWLDALGPALHPDHPAGAARDVEDLFPGRGARAGQHPGGGAGAARGQSLRRHADRGHVRVRAGVLRPLQPAAAVPPARARPGLQAAGRAREPVALRHGAGVAGEHGAGARARRGAARLPGRRPRDVQAHVGVGQDRLRREDRLRAAGHRARRADRAGGGDRRPGDRSVPRPGPEDLQAAAAGQPVAG